MTEEWSSPKLWVSVACWAVSTGMLFYNKLSGDNYVNVISWTLAAYIAGAAYQGGVAIKTTGRVNARTEGPQEWPLR